MMKINEATRKTLHLEFGSIAELAEYANSDDSVKKPNSTQPGMAPMDYAKAISAGVAGGHGSADFSAIRHVEINADNLTAHDLPVPRPQMAAYGHRPNVPAYLGGSPNSMWRTDMERLPNKLLRVAVNIGRAASVEHGEALRRGNAIMSAIDTLANMGYSLEVWAVWRNSDQQGNSVHIDTLIKDSDKSWSPDSVAFALADVSFQRRIVWRAVEIADKGFGKESYAPKALIRGALGSGIKAKYSDFDIHFPYMMAGTCDTGKAARETVTAEIAKQMANK